MGLSLQASELLDTLYVHGAGGGRSGCSRGRRALVNVQLSS